MVKLIVLAATALILLPSTVYAEVNFKSPVTTLGNNGWFNLVKIPYTFKCGIISLNSTYIPSEGNTSVIFYEQVSNNKAALYSKENEGSLEVKGNCEKNTPDTNLQQVWSANFKYEKEVKDISIISPKPEYNTNSSSLKVTGSVTTASGIESVHVNGTSANINGDSWSANIILEEGLNKVTAKVTSVAGNVKEASISVFYLPIINTPPQTTQEEQDLVQPDQPTAEEQKATLSNEEEQTVLSESKNEIKIATESASNNDTQVLSQEKESNDYAKIALVSFILGGVFVSWKLNALSFLKKKFSRP